MEKADITVPLFLLQGGRKFGVLRSERIAYGHTWISKADAAGLPGQGGVHIVFGRMYDDDGNGIAECNENDVEQIRAGDSGGGDFCSARKAARRAGRRLRDGR